MRHLGKLAAVAVAALALITPAAAQADPGVNVLNSDGWVEFVGKTKCSWAGVAVTGSVPGTVTVPANSVNVTCTNGYWGNLNQDLVVNVTDTTATVDVADVTGGALFFWCRYIKSPVVLNRVNAPAWEFYGEYQVNLDSSNWSDQCSNPANVRVWVKFY